MLPMLRSQRLLLGCVQSRKCSAQYKHNACTLTQPGFSNAQDTSIDNDAPCSRTSTPLPKPLCFGDRPPKTTPQLDAAPSLDTCSTCSEHRKAAYRSSGIKRDLLPISTQAVDYSLFSMTNHGFHNACRSIGCFPRERCGCHPSPFPRRNTTPIISRTKDNACSLPSPTFASVRWCSSRAVGGGNVIPLEHSKPVQTGEIKKFLSENEFVHREGYTCLISTCPRHVRRKIKLSELDRLYINLTTGYFVCQSCKKSGNWQQLKENMCNLLETISQKKRKPSSCFDGMTLEDGMADGKKAQELWEACIPVSDLRQENWDLLTYHLKIQGLDRESLERYQVRAVADQDGLALPVVNLDGKVVGVKTVTMQTVKTDDKETIRIVTRTIPRLDYRGLFGYGTLKSGDKELVLTANEFDAIAVSQATGLRAVALPRGDSVLPQQVLPMLEDFTKVTVWLGGSAKTWETAKQFSKKLNDSRCHLIRPGTGQPNALAAVQAGLDLSSIIQSAKLVRHKSIISFRNLRQDVFSELAMHDQLAGVKWKRYPQMNTLLKGHRRGELTVFTGPTGSGKTTFISDYSLDLCVQGVNTLWGSFEINNVRLLKTMLTQFAQLNLVKRLDAFDHWADQFELLPMYLMTFHGQENIRNVIETMSHAVYVQDIAHVVVDNLQFMMGLNSFSSTDRYIVQDKVISAFRKFATNMNCHVTLVIHPRKERDTDELTVSSIFGSAKASQEADNILILQDKRLTSVRGRKYVQVAKNRFDGELGIMLLKFNKDTKSFSTVSPSDGTKEDSPKKGGHH